MRSQGAETPRRDSPVEGSAGLPDAKCISDRVIVENPRHIACLGRRHSAHFHGVKYQRRRGASPLFTPFIQRFRRRTGCHTTHYRVNHGLRVAVSDVVYGVCHLEIKQREAFKVKFDADALVSRQIIVTLLHNHILDLRHQVIGRRLGIGSGHIHPYHYVRLEILTHHIYREIVIYASVICKHTVNLYGLEYQRKTHRRPDSISKVAM